MNHDVGGQLWAGFCTVLINDVLNVVCVCGGGSSIIQWNKFILGLFILLSKTFVIWIWQLILFSQLYWVLQLILFSQLYCISLSYFSNFQILDSSIVCLLHKWHTFMYLYIKYLIFLINPYVLYFVFLFIQEVVPLPNT